MPLTRRGLLGALLLAAPALAAPKRNARPDYPLRLARLTVGRSTEADARRLFGTGLFVRDEGHGGGRYYVDPGERVTLHVETGVDHVLDSIEYRRGIHLPAPYQDRKALPRQSVARALTPDERLDGVLQLGASIQQLRRRWGPPKQDTRRGALRILRYENDDPDELFYEAEFRFEQERLTGIRLYYGC